MTTCDIKELRKKLQELKICDDDLLKEQEDFLTTLALTSAVKSYQHSHELKQQLLKERKKAQDLTQALKEEKAARQEGFQLPGGLVPSISAAAQNETKRDEYYKKFLNQQPIRGGFVAHSIFIRFVKGARGEHKKRSDAWNMFESRAKQLVQALKDGKDRSFLSNKTDLEAPQSLVASQLLSMALDAWRHHVEGDEISVSNDNPLVFVSHQGEIKRNNILDDLEILSSDNNRKVEYKVDVMASLISEGMMKIISTMEYKPDARNAPARTAQRDMYATNTISLHRRLCIGMDIAGGYDVADWKITAMAYFASPKKKDTAKFECSKMYDGSGLDALFSVAVGIYEAAKDWTDTQNRNELRLGPVVARHNNRVYKAYDDATFRRPNLDIVREMFDESAQVWKSQDGKVEILEMEYRYSEWNGRDVKCGVFVDILRKLAALHEKEKVIHGDIRLANLLHSDGRGFIIDFDFTHLRTYPDGLKKLTLDGGRHPDVDKAIDQQTIRDLEMEKKHDMYSLGKVMGLFTCVGASEDEELAWKSATDACLQNSSIDDIVKSLTEKVSSLCVRLDRDKINAGLQLFETGPTPQKQSFRYSSSLSRSMPSVDE